MSTTISVEMAQGTSPKRLRHCCSSRVAAVQLSPPAPVGYQWQPDGWPGPFLSSEGAHAAGVMGTEFKKQIVASTSLGRVGQPEDIARVAVFLASDDAGWLTGEIIFANGGNK